MIVRRRLNGRRMGPSSLSISRRLFMSDLLMVLVSRMAMTKAGRKINRPMIRLIQLLKAICDVRA